MVEVVGARPGHECLRVTIVQWHRYHSRERSPPFSLATLAF